MSRGQALQARNALVLAAGMPRSGSTWLYNATRLLLAGNALSFEAGWLTDVRDRVGRAPLLLKLHEFDDELVRAACVIVYSVRDLRDALASAQRKFGRAPSLAQARRLVEQDRRWSAAADYVMRYEAMIAEPGRTLDALADALGLETGDVEALQATLEGLDYRSSEDGNGRYNTVNLLHAGHVTDGRPGGWRDQLEPALVKALEAEFANWFADNGYTIEH